MLGAHARNPPTLRALGIVIFHARPAAFLSPSQQRPCSKVLRFEGMRRWSWREGHGTDKGENSAPECSMPSFLHDLTFGFVMQRQPGGDLDCPGSQLSGDEATQFIRESNSSAKNRVCFYSVLRQVFKHLSCLVTLGGPRLLYRVMPGDVLKQPRTGNKHACFTLIIVASHWSTCTPRKRYQPGTDADAADAGRLLRRSVDVQMLAQPSEHSPLFSSFAIMFAPLTVHSLPLSSNASVQALVFDQSPCTYSHCASNPSLQENCE